MSYSQLNINEGNRTTGLSGWHIIIALQFGLVLVPVIGIIVTLNARRNRRLGAPDTRSEKYDSLSIVAFVLAFFPFLSIVAVVLGHVALARIKRTRYRGWGLTISALWIGYYVIGAMLLIAIATAVAVASSNG